VLDSARAEDDDLVGSDDRPAVVGGTEVDATAAEPTPRPSGAEPRLLLLGSVELRVDGERTALGGPVQRAVLVALALQRDHPVEVDHLLADVWGPDTPERTARSLATLVSRLRRMLEPLGSSIEHEHGAYVLRRAPPTDVDLFGEHVERARRLVAAGDPAHALTELDRALVLWRGEPLGGLTAPFVDERRSQLVEQRWVVENERAALLTSVGAHDRAVATLEEMTAETPYSERRWAMLIGALHAAGRRRDALLAYRRIDLRLREDIGIDPGPELRAAEMRVLEEDPLDPTPTEAGGAAARGAGALPGRHRELLRLGSVLARSRDRGTSTVIVGEAGIGKSTILGRVVAAAGDQQRVVVGRCTRGSTSVTSVLVAPIVSALRGLGGGDPLDHWEELGPEGEDLRRLATPGAGFDPRLLGMLEQRIVACTSAALHRLLDEGAVMVAVDDVHWADRVTRRCIDELMSAFADRPLSVLLCSRPAERTPTDDGWVADLLDRPGLEVIRLGPIPDADIGRILAQHGAPAERIEDLVAATGGIPMLAVELASLARRGEAISTHIPDRLRHILDLRFDALPDSALRLVRLVALERPTGSPSVMGAALGLDPLDTADLIDAATASGAVAIAADGSIGFPHELIRAYFLDRLGAQASKVARTALLEAHVARDEMGAAARHAEVLGDDIAAERRFAVLVPAARDALDEGATEDAHRWAHLALSLGPPDGPLSSDDIDRHLVLGTVLVSLGSFVQARPVLLRTAEAARDSGRWSVVADTLEGLGRIGQPHQGPDLEAYETLVSDALGGLVDDDERLGRLESLAFHIHSGPDPVRAERHLERLAELARREPALRHVLDVCRFRHEVEHGSDVDRCVRTGPRLADRMRSSGDEFAALIVDALTLTAQLRAGRPVAPVDVDAAADRAAALGRPDIGLMCELITSAVATWSRPTHAADAIVTAASDLAFSTGDSAHALTAVLHTFSLRREQGRASIMLPALLALSGTYDHPALDCLIGLCHREAEDTDAARERLVATWDGLAELERSAWEHTPLVALAVELAVELGEPIPPALRDRVDQALLPTSGSMIVFAGVGMHLGPGDLHLGRLAGDGGDPAEAVESLRSAAALARRAGLDLWACWCDVWLAIELCRATEPTAVDEATALLAGARRAARRNGWVRLGRAVEQLSGDRSAFS